MINSIIYATLAGVVGTGLGGVIGVSIDKKTNLVPAFLYFSAGFMLATVSFELVPSALARGDLRSLVIGFVMGIAIVIVANIIFGKMINQTESRIYKLGLTIFLAIAIHNFPEGLAIGGGEIGGLGMSIALLIAIHDIPEGLAMTLPLHASGVSKLQCIAIALLSGVPTAIGGAVGGSLCNSSPLIITYCLAIASGSMTYVTFNELIPTATATLKDVFSLSFAPFGFVLGMFLCNII